MTAGHNVNTLAKTLTFRYMVRLHSVLARQRVVQCVFTPCIPLSRSSTAQLFKPTHRAVSARQYTPRISMTATTSSTVTGGKPGIIRMGAKQESQLQIAQEMVDFINESWSPYHAVGMQSYSDLTTLPLSRFRCGKPHAHVCGLSKAQRA